MHFIHLFADADHSYCHTDADGKISVKFGVLFNDDQCANLFEALVGTLKAAKRKKIIAFEGELLLQGVHDNVDVILLQDWIGRSFSDVTASVKAIYILIRKYTWECKIFVNCIGIFLYTSFFSLRGVICTTVLRTLQSSLFNHVQLNSYIIKTLHYNICSVHGHDYTFLGHWMN